ncbi:hypothetical protein C8Q79DRAFT_608946 [Trametes meyenii]|nr:hypothetical protein C8Q79DRAFT_608946 [Trametes meyenii]
MPTADTYSSNGRYRELSSGRAPCVRSCPWLIHPPACVASTTRDPRPVAKAPRFGPSCARLSEPPRPAFECYHIVPVRPGMPSFTQAGFSAQNAPAIEVSPRKKPRTHAQRARKGPAQTPAGSHVAMRLICQDPAHVNTH